MRRVRRRLAGRRLRRHAPPTGTDSAGAAPPAPPRPMRCMCGTIVEIAEDDDGQRKSCATCGRRFDVQLTPAGQDGQAGVSLHYLTNDNERSGETSVIGAATTSVHLPSVDGKAPLPPGVVPSPDPPKEALLQCKCGSLLLVEKQHYENRVKCPDCNARLLTFMVFDPRMKSFSLQTFSLVDKVTGKTQILKRI